MEERIIDDEEGRKIRLIRLQNGETDAVEDTADAETAEAENGETVEEFVVDYPDSDEYDEDLVGLTPSQLQEELERREKAMREAREQSEKFTAEADEKLAAGDFGGAEELYEQAVMFDVENEPAGRGLWLARTKNFTDDGAFYKESNAEQLAGSPEAVKAFVLERTEERLRAAREEFRTEAAPLRETVEKKQEERREPFLANRKYYLIRLYVCAAAIAVFLIALIVSSRFIVRTVSPAPVVLTAVFGALAFLFLIALAMLSRKYIVADRLCRLNEKLSSTEEGARLEDLENRIRCLDLIFGD